MPISTAQAPKCKCVLKTWGISGVLSVTVTEKMLSFTSVYHANETFSTINSWKREVDSWRTRTLTNQKNIVQPSRTLTYNCSPVINL